MHMLGVDEGSQAIWDAVVKEFLDCSKAGCNHCHFGSTIRFAEREVYYGHRRYLKKIDIRRKKKIISSTCRGALIPELDPKLNLFQRLQYPIQETKLDPENRTYEEYKRNGLHAMRHNMVVDGVKGLWKLDVLPYAEYILWVCDSMHTFCNVIRDAMSIFKRGEDNRTMKKDVRDECKRYGIYAHLWTKNLNDEYSLPRWVFSTKEVNEVNQEMGNYHVSQRIQDPIYTCGGVYSHDKLNFAINYAPRVLKDKGDFEVTENTIDLFAIIAYFWQNSFEKEELESTIRHLKDVLACREGLLPPTESTFCLHEIIHVADQVALAGPPRFSSTFKYE